ncbi:NnrS family protein [Afifella sp. IM 167]|uniref:NnrS family protein n=1 Tax=Afifella sp. IM 167 TaxID=2033586 RepID=UPI001CCE1400|nr:NnrS family protein [Afifella sp. IM 167]
MKPVPGAGEAGGFFGAPFRPFFLAALILAACAIPVWTRMYLSGFGEVAGMPALAWHAHEMVFGYLPAAMAGYLLSPAPGSGAKPAISGLPLALLLVLWFAGRLLPLVLPAAGAVLDAAFPLAVTAFLLRAMRAGESRLTRHGLALFPLIAIASLTHRLVCFDPQMAATLARLGVAIGALLIAAVGGRIIPEATRAALPARERAKVAEPYRRFDILVLLAAAPALGAWVLAPQSLAEAILLLAAGALHLARLVRWRGWRVREAKVLALHAGYVWLAAATLLAGLSAEPFALVPADLALHAFAAGAIGTMTMAVMARLAVPAALGAPARLALIFVHLGAVLRVSAVLLSGAYLPLLVAGAFFWSLGFAIFVLVLLPPRRRRRSAPDAAGAHAIVGAREHWRRPIKVPHGSRGRVADYPSGQSFRL